MNNRHTLSYDFFKEIYKEDFVEDILSWKPSDTPLGHNHPQLTSEQQELITFAMQGKNVLVDACIGSGKTTSIQALCDMYPGTKKILYLTYNKLLKLDAKSKIHNRNVTVTNYHGFAYMLCARYNLRAGKSDTIQTVLNSNIRMPRYDVLILDEYQDIDEEIATLITRIKEQNPGIQLIAVGDMKQKIYNKTTLAVWDFITDFLGDYVRLNFTQCFRLCKTHADRLSYIWNKKIVGVNNNCKIAVANMQDTVEFLSTQNPSDIICLGPRTGQWATALNILEEQYPDRYNKQTIYASIQDSDNSGVKPNPDSGIFTTYDGSKGLERKICVLFDFVPSYWPSESECLMLIPRYFEMHLWLQHPAVKN